MHKPSSDSPIYVSGTSKNLSRFLGQQRRFRFRAIVSLLITVFTLSLGAPANALVAQNTVTFFQNASANDSTKTFQIGGSSQDLTLLSGLDVYFSKASSIFLNWNTAKDGSGVTYADGALFAFTTDMNLYAQWSMVPVARTVTLIENANGSDLVKTFAIGTSSGNITSFASLSPAFANAGYTFSSWNTSADGSGTLFADGAAFSFAVDLTLFAQWLKVPPVVTSFGSNGGSGSVLPVSSQSGLSITLPTGTGLVNTGHTFVGWNTAPDGTGTQYLSGATYVFTNSEVLYAQWTPNAYVISFALGSSAIAPSTVNFTYGGAPILLSTPILVGNQFNGWFTSSTAGTLIGVGGSSFTPTASVMLYAQWTPIAQVTISFSANGGSGSISPISGLPGSSITLPGQTGLLRSGYSLTRWNTTAKGTGASYTPGQSLTMLANSMLYAQWTGRAPAALYGAIGTFAPNSSQLNAALKIQVNRLSLLIRAKKYSSVTLYGYSAATGLASLNMSLSRGRATNVQNYLRARLHALHLRNVLVKSSGQGSISGGNSGAYSRVEVFVR